MPTNGFPIKPLKSLKVISLAGSRKQPSLVGGSGFGLVVFVVFVLDMNGSLQKWRGNQRHHLATKPPSGGNMRELIVQVPASVLRRDMGL